MAKRILVVDDEPGVCRLVRRHLEGAGYLVDEAGDGNAAMAKFRQSPPDLVLIDLIMPDKEGLETIRELRREAGAVPVVAMSGGDTGVLDNYLKTAVRLGATRALRKPINFCELQATLAGLLARPA